METKTYNGNDLFHPFNAGLYGYDEDSDRSMQNEESKASILSAFKGEYEDEIREALAIAGIRLDGFAYYSPREYNFATDSIDLTITLEDEGKYIEATNARRAEIQAMLDANRSYDGYMALTSDTFEEARDRMELPVIRALLAGIDFEEFDIDEHIEYAYPCEHCDLIHEDREYMDAEDLAKVEECEKAG